MLSKPENLFRDNLKMYPHLLKIREKLWANDTKSRVSIMIGAGFSKNAAKIESSFEGMALWEDLKERLIKDLSHHENISEKDVLEIGQIYSDEYGRSTLDELLKASIPDENYEPDQLHYQLLNLPWTDVYTTNYDTLLERAKKSVYERSYQVIYDVNDIPSSVQPRIVKLHGSFPANRPFVFTKKDYDNYPKNFSPFVNMVQQSIMETTFVLIGFSGEDPNFSKWISWVQENLKEHMPKIYMIGLKEKADSQELEKKGITLIDFKEVYPNGTGTFKMMFDDLFEFLSYKERLDKLKWPYKKYISSQNDFFTYNRSTYPGWTIMPDEIRRTNLFSLWKAVDEFIDEIVNLSVSEITEEKILQINDVIWNLEKYYIPIDYSFFIKLKEIVSSYNNDRLHTIILRLLKEARLDCNILDFDYYVKICEELNLNEEENHTLIYEKILYHLSLNKIEEVFELLNNWIVGTKEIDWGVKKACIYLRIDEVEKGEFLFEDYLQTIRSLLAIKMDDYRLLTLESIILHHLDGHDNKTYGFDRLKTLSTKYCDSNKEFKTLLRSVKEYSPEYGTKETPEFDPGRETVTTNYGDAYQADLYESYAVLQIKEEFAFQQIDNSQYNLALENIKTSYNLYALIKQIFKARSKDIKTIFTREFVYGIKEEEKKALLIILDNSLLLDKKSLISNDKALEIYSRIYMVLGLEEQHTIDVKLLDFLNNQKEKTLQEIKILKLCISRILYAKNVVEAGYFIEKLIALDIEIQRFNDKSAYLVFFFEPILEVIKNHKKVKGLNIPTVVLEGLLDKLENPSDDSTAESAFIRLCFLVLTQSLNSSYIKRFEVSASKMPSDKKYGISDFLTINGMGNLVNGTNQIDQNKLDEFMIQDIPIFYTETYTSDGSAVIEYFSFVRLYFKGFYEPNSEKKPDKAYYLQLLDKFYIWWESQKPALLQTRDLLTSVFFTKDTLQSVVYTLKNNIWGSIPLDYLRETDKEKASLIFNELNQKRPELSSLLIPSLQRMRVEESLNLEYLIDSVTERSEEKSKKAISSLLDYSIFIFRGEINEDLKTISSELLEILKYGNGEKLKEAIKTISKIIEFDSSILDDEVISLIIKYVNKYLAALKTEELKIEKTPDFQLLASYAELVAVLLKYKREFVGLALHDWEEYITSHKLPEVRMATMYFN
ncbi:SIR2-like domain-containing protein [Planococcus glaciei]|uniref:SIR2 family NAD-dependent protein deacylase n=1 Tax=Planococcus glaciei TaxID=459472 RepID=UPI00088219DA|nr:SIR2 family protein [Planococcus glaciei]SDI41620.1 SIR2-like domain-containing protein [Planococcus glaciei]